MRFYSTNNRKQLTSLKSAVLQGLAADNGLYMPEEIPMLSKSFFDGIHEMPFRQIAMDVAAKFAGEEIPPADLKKIIDHTLQFDAPLVEIENNISALELFHGPTMAFKDFGARFMSQLLAFFSTRLKHEIVILVATSGDTGSAVANGFLGVPGIRVIVLYPSGKVSDIQEKQFTTLGKNITAFEVMGTFDDCQRLVKSAFLDGDLRDSFFLTSANSINIARLIPQSFYYFYAYAKRKHHQKPVVFSVPSGNFGNLTGGVLAKRMGLPVEKFIAATNVNDVVPEYLKTGNMIPRPSQHTISNAMDVGNPSNFARLMDLYQNDFNSISQEIEGYAFTDSETAAAMQNVAKQFQYTLDPHGAIGYLGLKQYFSGHEREVNGIFLETAHPAKFQEVVEQVIHQKISLPPTLEKFAKGKKQSLLTSKDYADFKKSLIGVIGK
ncbi:MAG: threonine synthase [Cyclobacteriaceae bacterium]